MRSAIGRCVSEATRAGSVNHACDDGCGLPTHGKRVIIKVRPTKVENSLPVGSATGTLLSDKHAQLCVDRLTAESCGNRQE